MSQPEPGSAAEGLTIRRLLEMDVLRGAHVLAGGQSLDRPVLRLNVMTTPDILPWAQRDELMLVTDYPLPKEVAELSSLIEAFAARGLAGLAVKTTQPDSALPVAVREVADAAHFPLILIPVEAAFDEILTAAFGQILTQQAQRIAHADQVHRTLLDVVLAGGDLTDIATRIASTLPGGHVVITDDSLEPLAFDPASQGERDELLAAVVAAIGNPSDLTHTSQVQSAGADIVMAPIRAGAVIHGVVAAVGPGLAQDAGARLAVEQAAIVCALERVRSASVRSVHRQYAASLMHDLVHGTATLHADTLSVAESFGWDLRRDVIVIAAAAERASVPPDDADGHLVEDRQATAWVSQIRAVDPAAAAAAFAGTLVAICGADKFTPLTLSRLVSDMSSRARRTFMMGVSQRLSSPERIPRAFQESRHALTVGRQLRQPLTEFRDLGLFRLLCLIDDDRELDAFIHDTLGPVLDLDVDERDDLLRTLSVLLASHMNVAEAARATHFHYNTMRYRISKLERLLGPFMTDGQLTLMLSVALEARRLRASTPLS